jgi:hypothetical protein
MCRSGCGCGGEWGRQADERPVIRHLNYRGFFTWLRVSRRGDLCPFTGVAVVKRSCSVNLRIRSHSPERCGQFALGYTPVALEYKPAHAKTCLATASGVRGASKLIGGRICVTSLPSWAQNQRLTEPPIMVHTRPPFELKHLILLGCGRIVERRWISCE